ncbi:SAM-dependent methyltransferase [Oxalicibacterium faecigallinarum]|uniref:Cyclopropane-fatty-acyl-phospholipid synthase n=1 Tax=Oxalicibacterium faecigallinarum TaxID=573741 RepID=A0A8J3F3P0_9BURK|nr:cyclopropane-fatty-acyl-phospholipid synthase family protein [Oxalicibacterium faecigallinarum]GGI20596.1 cyclopropane-fatty-acyl-phospholipid synthase [Oxalicibacterium faecigallinarum]
MKIKSSRALSLQAPDTIPLSGQLLFSLLERIEEGSLRVTTPEGMVHLFGRRQTGIDADMTIHDWRAARPIMMQGDIGFAESLRRGWVGSESLVALFRLVIRNQQMLEQAIHGKWWALLMRRLAHVWLNNNSRAGSKRNIQAHYDLGNSFYQLWLDASMTYSSAWFGGQEQLDLYCAQQAKYQRILDELDARPGQRVLEIGCGWGGFAEYAAQRGLHVYGITLSPSQLAYAEQRMRTLGLEKYVTLTLQDYRHVEGQFDHIVSIEMLEAVGETHWPTYFSMLKRSLKPNGKIVLQSIDIADAHFAHYRRSTDFIQQFIFPGGMLPSPSVLHTQSDHVGLRVERHQSFGLDYALTLHHWHRAFMAQREQIRAQGFDEPFMRLWEMYLKYCEAGFLERRTDVALWTLGVRQPCATLS